MKSRELNMLSNASIVKIHVVLYETIDSQGVLSEVKCDSAYLDREAADLASSNLNEKAFIDWEHDGRNYWVYSVPVRDLRRYKKSDTVLFQKQIRNKKDK